VENFFKDTVMKLWPSFFIFLSFSVLASSDLDQKLLGYVKTFQLKPASSPGEMNKNLFYLGRDLFFEKKLSGNKNISCADCHHPRTMTTDLIPLSLGEGAEGLEVTSGGRVQKKGKILLRNSPALFNLHNVNVFFWDGRVQWNPKTSEFITPEKLPSEFIPVLKNALAAQALFPMLSHEEMRGEKGTNEIADAPTAQRAWELLFKRIINVPKYKTLLLELFPGENLSIAHVARAISHFEEQAFYSGDSNFDRYLKGDLLAMSETQKKGMDVFFEKGKCGSCHRGEHLSGFGFHNIGVPQIGPEDNFKEDLGKFAIDPRPETMYAFRIPPLRNVALTPPYMHDGAFKTLSEVIEHYDDIESSLKNYVLIDDHKNYNVKLLGPESQMNEKILSTLSRKLERNLFFTEEEEKALEEFLVGALTGRRFLPLVRKSE